MKRALLGLLAAAGAVPMIATAAAVPASAAAPAPALTGYRQVVSQQFIQAPHSNTHTDVSCPAGTNAIGGGAVMDSAGFDQNLNTSIPSPNGTNWAVWTNNTSDQELGFRLWVDCAAGIGNYSVVAGTYSPVRAGHAGSAEASCPAGTVPFGGGAFLNSTDTATAMNSSVPTATGWRVRAVNGSTEDTEVAAYVACGKRSAGYQQVVGTATFVKAGTQGSATAACPAGTKVFGGGGLSSLASTAITLNSSAPTSARAWQVFENNADAVVSRLTAYTVCGQASR